jgi:glutathione S-transferase
MGLRTGTREVEDWNRRSEELMVAGRALLLPRLIQQDEALREQLPAVVPRRLRQTLRPLAVMGARHIMRKYGITAAYVPSNDVAVRAGLDQLRQALAEKGDHLVAGRFSYADITMATALQFFVPVRDEFIRLGPGTRAAWTHRGRIDQLDDLVAWRDRLYERWRRPTHCTGAIE